MAQQLSDGQEVHSGLHQTGGVGVSQGVWRDGLVQSGFDRRLLAGFLDDRRTHGAFAGLSGKEPSWRLQLFPILPQRLQQSWREWHETLFVSLASGHPMSSRPCRAYRSMSASADCCPIGGVLARPMCCSSRQPGAAQMLVRLAFVCPRLHAAAASRLRKAHLQKAQAAASGSSSLGSLPLLSSSEDEDSGGSGGVRYSRAGCVFSWTSRSLMIETCV